MPSFSRLIRFESLDDGQRYFADIGADTVELPATGSHVTAYASIDGLVVREGGITVTVGKVRPSFPQSMYCLFTSSRC
jgi:hypothetical protein